MVAPAGVLLNVILSFVPVKIVAQLVIKRLIIEIAKILF
jgi:hypothetical protein